MPDVPVDSPVVVVIYVTVTLCVTHCIYYPVYVTRYLPVTLRCPDCYVVGCHTTTLLQFLPLCGFVIWLFIPYIIPVWLVILRCITLHYVTLTLPFTLHCHYDTPPPHARCRFPHVTLLVTLLRYVLYVAVITYHVIPFTLFTVALQHYVVVPLYLLLLVDLLRYVAPCRVMTFTLPLPLRCCVVRC